MEEVKHMKKPLAYILTAGLAVSLIASGTIYAEEPANSNATVNFTAPDDPVGPVDPTDPTQPNTDSPEDNGNITGQNGPLSLDYVSHLDFGNQEISTSEEIYSSETTEPYIQVTDLRGSGEGWDVTAEVSNFISDEDGTVSLPSSSIQLNNGDTVSTSESANPVVPASINLVTGGDSTTVVSAASRVAEEPVNTAQGLGTWVTRWLAGEGNTENGNVTLTVPGSTATAGSHTATITWTLETGPTGE